MKKIDWTEAVAWKEFLQDNENEDVVVMREGHAIALLTPFDDDDLYWYERENDPAFIESIEVARCQVREGKTISHQDLKRKLGLE